MASGWRACREQKRPVGTGHLHQVHHPGADRGRGERKFADYVLFYKPNIPIAVVEAKDNTHRVGPVAGIGP